MNYPIQYCIATLLAKPIRDLCYNQSIDGEIGSELLMAIPKPKAEPTQDDDTTVSPDGDTTAQRYAKVREREARMTMEERIEELYEGERLFNEMFPDFY